MEGHAYSWKSIIFCSGSFSNAVHESHCTELNRTLPHVQKLSRFNNKYPKYGAQKLPIYGCFYDDIKTSLNIFATNRDVDKQAEPF